MIPLSARQSRLARQIITSTLHSHASIPLRRSFSVSIAQRFNKTVSRCKDEKAKDSSEQDADSIAKSIKGNEKAEGKKSKSRLSALKKNSTKKAPDENRRLIFGQTVDKPIRTRFAPSPTGDLHLGSLRTALVNNLLATATQGGEFILRLEDTDQNRLVPGAEERIYEDLKWGGLEWTEGPDKAGKGGPYGPYRQSERLPIYQEHTKQLIDKRAAYRCFCSHETLEAHNRAEHDAGRPTVYPGTCRSIPLEESDKRAEAGESHVVRLNGSMFGRPSFKDAIYGPFQKAQEEEDFVLMKSDGYPTYHLANVVDDHLMKITHVVRGEEWLISTPKHIALYEAFGWKAPTFAHLGLLTEDNGAKLSKRNASVNLSTYKSWVFPIALQSWLANLGSHFLKGTLIPRTLQEVSDALTFKFTRGGIKLNPGKLKFYQNAYRTRLLSVPDGERSSSEMALITDHLINPLLAEVDTLTAGPNTPAVQPPKAYLPWTAPLTQMREMEHSRETQAFRVIRGMTEQYADVRELARKFPYFFWVPPDYVYQHSLVKYGVDREILTEIRKCFADQPEKWDEVLVDCVAEICKVHSPEDVHNLIRMILVGDPNTQTRNTRTLFSIIGRRDSHDRLLKICELLEELEAGGEQTRQKWLEMGEEIKQRCEKESHVVS